MKKKLICFVVATLMVATASLFATGQSEETSESGTKEPVTIIWLKKGGLGSTNARIEILKETQPELMSRVEILPQSGDPHSIANNLRLALASKTEVPDVIKLSKPELIEFVKAGVVLDITDRMKTIEDQLFPAAYDLGFVDGRAYAVTNQLKTKIWYYRKDIFDEMGLDVKDIKNTDDFIAAGLKIQTKYPKANMWNFGTSIGHYNLHMITSGNGARYYDKNGEYIVASDPGTRQAFVDMKKMQDAGIIADVSDWTPDWEQAFRDEEIVSTLQASWFHGRPGGGYLQKWIPEQAGKWAVALWPNIAGGAGGAGSESGGGVYAIMKDSKNADIAFEVLTALTTDPDTTYKLKTARGVDPFNYAAFEKYPELSDPLPFYSNNYWEVEAEAIKVHKELPSDANGAKEHIIMNEFLQEWLLGAYDTVDECLAAAESELKNQIGNAFEF
jgi:multiple sugar transport system substrate-binding protein